MHRTNTLRNALLIGALCSLYAPFTAYAQVHVGLVGGVNVATISTEDPDVDELSSRMLWGIGGVLGVDLGRHFGLRVEPMLLRKGVDQTVNNGSEENEIRFSYLEVPILATYTFSTGPARPYLMAGPAASF